ncbi:MAG TPA: slipin family protein, partial [Chloroflexota bacterium]|nr:slipin family protein [Chloroflexota bacterium]
MPGVAIVPAGSGQNLPSGNAPRPNILGAVSLLVPAAAGAAVTALTLNPIGLIVGAGIGLVASLSPKIARQWERAVVLRWGRYVGLRGPGPFWVIPFVDTIPSWIDQRTITTSFSAEQTLTADTVPVNVDAVLFWTVYDPEKAALEVQDYVQAVSWAAQTALRDIIGRTSLTELLRGRMQIEKELQALIDHRTTPWGVTVHSVEMRDVVIPAALQDAMSREAQAAREKQARIILGQAEVEIAKLFEQASEAYQANPTALQLRQMNILYEGLKQKGGMMVVPSSIVDSMGPSGLLAATALARTQQQAGKSDAAPEHDDQPSSGASQP